MKTHLPKIGVVIIGINVDRYVADCIKSVRECDYPQDLLKIVYVDGGSTDNSVRKAKEFDSINVIELNDIHPTPGKGRNAGWQSLSTPLIQFLDADTTLHPMWFKKAIPEINDGIAAVCGLRKERCPNKNLFHFITDLEWGYAVGLCRHFGGDVLILRKTLERTGGYDSELIAGEDPEYSYRVRQKGLKILRMDTLMTIHDINMKTPLQYMKRAYRSGHAYAEISMRFRNEKEKLYLREFIRIVLRTLVPYILFTAGVLSGYIFTGIILGILLLCRPVLSISRLKRELKQPWKQTILYTLHTVIVIYPQFFGILRYFYGVLFKSPLQNKVAKG